VVCHGKGIIHRDLKLENVLFYDKEKTIIKICDFGIAGFCLNHLKEKTNSGTFKYMAPEVLKGEKSLANPAMDIWSTGMMMYLMLFGFHPFLPPKYRFSNESYPQKELVQNIINLEVQIPQIDISTSSLKGMIPVITEEARDLLYKLLNKNFRERINLIDLQSHPWFSLSEEDILNR